MFIEFVMPRGSEAVIEICHLGRSPSNTQPAELVALVASAYGADAASDSANFAAQVALGAQRFESNSGAADPKSRPEPLSIEGTGLNLPGAHQTLGESAVWLPDL